MKASELLELGKDAQDVIQAWVDPAMTKGKMAEMSELGGKLWNVQERWPEIKDHWKDFMGWVAAGAGLESLREYAGEWVEWDLPLFLESA